MLGSAFIAFFRSFTRHPLYGLLNLLGLAIGIAVFIVLSLLYHFETSYESWSPARSDIYAVGTRLHGLGISGDLDMNAMGDLLEEVKSSYPQTDGTRDMPLAVKLHSGADVFNEQVEKVDANFLSFFRMPVLRGDAAHALDDPSHIVLSARLARKYFGTVEVVGHNLTLDDFEGRKTYTISAVIADLPKNSDMRLDMLRLLTPKDVESWGALWSQLDAPNLRTYLKFKRPADEMTFAAQLPAFIDSHARAIFASNITPHKRIELVIMPLAEMHLISLKLNAAIISLGLVGVLTLALALINYVNLATARAGLRAREVAVRKTLGAPSSILRLQFLTEAVLTLLLAFLVALSAVELSLPLINAAGGLSLGIDYRFDAPWIFGLLGCVLAAGLLAALYPAFVLSAFKPALVLASSHTPGGGRLNGRLRTGLAMLQFTVVVVAFILMGGFILQIRHLEIADLGFRRDNLLIINSMSDRAVTPAQFEAFTNAARTLPAVKSVTFAAEIPGPRPIPGNFIQLTRPAHDNAPALTLNIKPAIIGPDYFQALGSRRLAGRLFDPQHGEDQMWAAPDGVLNVIVNRRAAKDLGFVSPQAAIGQTATLGAAPVRIIGVVEDMRFNSPNEAIPPVLYMYDLHTPNMGLVRWQGDNETAMREALGKVWRQIVPDVPYNAISVSENLDTYYRPERNRSHLFTTGTGMAALIGCMGLYGMAAFNASRRVREIGMRKVLGASRAQMVRLLLGQFLWPVALASLFAWPPAWLALQRWLAQFDDVIAMPLWLFPAASVAALLIAAVVVAGTAFSAAGTEPGRALRHD